MKRINRILLVAIALLLPLAARADLAYDGPPNDYTGFLFRHGYYRWGGLSNAMSGFGWPIVFVVVGGIILLAVRFLLSSSSKKAKRIVACSFAVFLAAAAIVASVQITRERETMVEVPLFRGWPDKEYKDTPQHRAEYDAHCLRIYGSWSYSGGKWYAFDEEVPKPRKDAPEEVKESYRRLYERVSEAIHRDYDRDSGRRDGPEGSMYTGGGE